MSELGFPAATPGRPHHPPRALRVLVADDDPSSRQFFADGLRRLGADPEVCPDGLAALACARGEAFDLLVLDCRMPGAGALQVLASLRRDGSRSADSYAVATSAEVGRNDRAELLAAGFDHVLSKPCSLADLQQVLVLAGASDARALLDDDAALASSGDLGTMRALRGLLCAELAGMHRELDELRLDRAQFAERLHRLRSSCGFCGAPALGAEAARLQRRLASADEAELGSRLLQFRQALLATLQALGGNS